MKKTIYTLLGLLLAAGLTSCQDWFIEKPEVTGMDQDEVFSTAKNAEGAIAEAYATILSSGLPVLVWNNSPIMPYETTEAIMGGEDLCRLTWGYMDKQVVAGMLANNENNGAGYTDDYFPNNYAYIRKAWLVYENIDKVADMSDRDKAIVKAEMQVLVAFRYVEMLKRYGGVPLVESTLTTVDVRPRSTVQQTLDFIVGLCDAAAATLEGVRWPADWLGRVNKGVALAVKAEALMYAARPLFNADAPYMQMADPANNEMIWLGGYDAKRWETARLANQEVIDWGKANGFELIDTGDPIKDYGTAVGTPSNREVLLAYKQQREADDNGIYKNYTFMPTHTGHDLGQYRGTGYGQLASTARPMVRIRRGRAWTTGARPANTATRPKSWNPVRRRRSISTASTPRTIPATAVGICTRTGSSNTSGRTAVPRTSNFGTKPVRANGSNSRSTAWRSFTSISPRPTTRRATRPWRCAT